MDSEEQWFNSNMLVLLTTPVTKKDSVRISGTRLRILPKAHGIKLKTRLLVLKLELAMTKRLITISTRAHNNKSNKTGVKAQVPSTKAVALE